MDGPARAGAATHRQTLPARREGRSIKVAKSSECRENQPEAGPSHARGTATLSRQNLP